MPPLLLLNRPIGRLNEAFQEADSFLQVFSLYQMGCRNPCLKWLGAMDRIASSRNKFVQSSSYFLLVKVQPLPLCGDINLQVVKKEPLRFFCVWIVKTFQFFFESGLDKLSKRSSASLMELSNIALALVMMSLISHNLQPAEH